jgi:hypothetical protein
MSAIFVFNQYYIDLLKKLKHISKKNKDNSSTAKKVLKAIKDNYVTFDKSSDEYISFIKSNFTDELWDSYINDEDDSWLKNNAEILLSSVFIFLIRSFVSSGALVKASLNKSIQLTLLAVLIFSISSIRLSLF